MDDITTHLKPWWAHYHYISTLVMVMVHYYYIINGMVMVVLISETTHLKPWWTQTVSSPSYVISQGVALNHWGNHRSGADMVLWVLWDLQDEVPEKDKAERH